MVKLLVVVALSGLLSAGCSPKSPEAAPMETNVDEPAGGVPPVSDTASTASTCAEQGVAYYKAIASYPTLSNGKPADDLILEKCRANPEMFKDMNL